MLFLWRQFTIIDNEVRKRVRFHTSVLGSVKRTNTRSICDATPSVYFRAREESFVPDPEDMHSAKFERHLVIKKASTSSRMLE